MNIFSTIKNFLGYNNNAEAAEKLKAENEAKKQAEIKVQEPKEKTQEGSKEASLVDSILVKAKQVKDFFEASQKKVKADGWLDYIGSYFGASAGNKMMDKFIDLVVKNYSLVDEEEVGYAVTINDILDKILKVMGDPNHKAEKDVNTKDKLSEITKLVDSTKKDIEKLSPIASSIFDMGLNLLSMVASFVGLIIGSALSNSKDETMKNIGTAATVLSGWKLFSDAKDVAAKFTTNSSSSDEMEHSDQNRTGTPVMSAA